MTINDYAFGIFNTLIIPTWIPFVFSYLSLCFFYRIRTNTLRSALWWPWITGMDNEGMLTIK